MARKSRKRIAPKPSVPNGVILAGLTMLMLIVFSQVASHTFLNYDDGQFVTENPHVIHGLTPDSIAWALTSASIGGIPSRGCRTCWMSICGNCAPACT